jgi:hypothetical protein
LSSVKIISVDAAKVRQRVDEYARELLATCAEVEEIIVFGSFENETYAPGSDVDLFIVLREADDSPRDRIPRFFLPNRWVPWMSSLHRAKSLSVGIAPLAAVNKAALAISALTLKARTDS